MQGELGSTGQHESIESEVSNNEGIGIRLSEDLLFIRQILGFTRSKMAKILSVSPHTLYQYENAREQISLVTALKVDFVLNELTGYNGLNGINPKQKIALGTCKESFHLFCRSHLFH